MMDLMVTTVNTALMKPDLEKTLSNLITLVTWKNKITD